MLYRMFSFPLDHVAGSTHREVLIAKVDDIARSRF